ncbi:hypothetical protein BDV98DRAFT_395024 [Pterulicium gracile]|uniref:COQ9 C-terminal domain-containing protein n=1 Tax=Pterulicium gracile TaxID=1884261 RepID=A0A5C3QPA2_9AGAR|nr:hypothetical protein BDV98DRAFT_395024 [Pterula gracilis]
MPAPTSTLLLRALPLIRTHGFTRETLSLAGAVPTSSGPNTTSKPAGEPLSDRAVSALFGEGDEARKTLIRAWLAEGLSAMNDTTSVVEGQVSQPMTVRDALRRRLEYNTPVLHQLPEIYALLASPRFATPLLDPMPALKHVSRVADTACRVGGDESLHLAWYSKRGSLAAIYGAAELHQLASPATAKAFLDSLLDGSRKMGTAVDETLGYSHYIVKSWQGILKSYSY